MSGFTFFIWNYLHPQSGFFFSSTFSSIFVWNLFHVNKYLFKKEFIRTAHSTIDLFFYLFRKKKKLNSETQSLNYQIFFFVIRDSGFNTKIYPKHTQENIYNHTNARTKNNPKFSVCTMQQSVDDWTLNQSPFMWYQDTNFPAWRKWVSIILKHLLNIEGIDQQPNIWTWNEIPFRRSKNG